MLIYSSFEYPAGGDIQYGSLILLHQKYFSRQVLDSLLRSFLEKKILLGWQATAVSKGLIQTVYCVLASTEGQRNYYYFLKI